MAIKPKKQTSSNRGETGGGAPRGGSRGLGGLKPKSKPAPKPNVTLKPEPSSMSVKANKYNLFGPEEAAKANQTLRAARSRTNSASAKVEKRALKAANKTTKTKSADEARKQAFDRVDKFMKQRNKDIDAKKKPANVTPEMSAARKNSLRFNPDGSKITPRQSVRDNKEYIKKYSPAKPKPKGKTAAKAWSAGAAATTGWVGNEMRKAYNKSKKKK